MTDATKLQDDTLVVRLPKMLKLRVQRRAKKLNMSVSELIRLLIVYGDAIDINRREF